MSLGLGLRIGNDDMSLISPVHQEYITADSTKVTVDSTKYTVDNKKI